MPGIKLIKNKWYCDCCNQKLANSDGWQKPDNHGLAGCIQSLADRVEDLESDDRQKEKFVLDN